jgi:hypothetical protein
MKFLKAPICPRCQKTKWKRTNLAQFTICKRSSDFLILISKMILSFDNDLMQVLITLCMLLT